jgi:hypothetical protein
MLGLLLWNSNVYHSNTNRMVAPAVDSSLRLLPAVCHRILAPAENLEERSVLLTSRGRSRSKDGSTSSSEAANADGDGGSSSASVAAGGLPPNPNPRPRSPWLPEGDSDSDSHVPGRLNGHRRGEGGEKTLPLSAYPITPDPSVRKVSSGSSFGIMSEEDAEQGKRAERGAIRSGKLSLVRLA